VYVRVCNCITSCCVRAYTANLCLLILHSIHAQVCLLKPATLSPHEHLHPIPHPVTPHPVTPQTVKSFICCNAATSRQGCTFAAATQAPQLPIVNPSKSCCPVLYTAIMLPLLHTGAYPMHQVT
jgi:hypothetical protein